MFLTRMPLNPARRGTRHLMGSPQRMHAAVMGGFPPTLPSRDAEGGGRVLWRVDVGERHELTLFVSSGSRPDLTHLVEQAGWPALEHGWSTADCEGFLARLADGQRWVFRLTANPVWAQSRGPGRASQRKAHVTVAQQEQWLLDRASRNGFTVPVNSMGARELTVRGRGAVQFPRHAESESGVVTLVRATFDGVLEVQECAQLRAALRNGIGRAKGYGCGLMTLAPLQ